jgi:AcrR family transcriptional regulator
MYRYYDGRDALLTDLLVDAYSDLADAVAHAAGLPPAGSDGDPAPDADVLTSDPGVPDPAGALLAAIEAYRAWAVANPSRFLLIFGTPVPGYSAPADGPTVAANRRMGRTFFTLGALAWRGHPDSAAAAPARPPTSQEQALLDQLRALCADLPASAVPSMVAGWALWHGLVTLEITGQLHWAYPDAAAYYTEVMAAWVEDFIGPG